VIELLFAAALADTFVAPDLLPDVVVLHEWGVVTLDGGMIAGGIPAPSSPEPWVDPGLLEDKAPVVLFYGADFTDATLTVELHGGAFTDVFPAPADDDPSDGVVTWSIAAGTDRGERYAFPGERVPSGGEDRCWAYDAWRDGPAHVLEFPDGTTDRFLYYECSFPFEPGDPPWPFHASRGVDPAFDGTVLVFDGYEDHAVRMAETTADHAADADLEWIDPDRETILGILCGMAGGEMKSGEISDLWDAWEGYVTGCEWQGDRLMVFRLPGELVERLSSITLETAEGRPTTTARFYLGMAPFSYTF